MMDATPDAAQAAKQRMAAELEANRGRTAGLENYAADLFCYRDGGPERPCDYLLTWVRVGSDRAGRANSSAGGSQHAVDK